MPVGDPADPLYAPYHKRAGLTRREDEAVHKAMQRDINLDADGLRQENLNRIFANLAKLNTQVGTARGDFPIKVSVGDNGMIISIDPSAIKKQSTNTVVLDRWQNGVLGIITVLTP